MLEAAGGALPAGLVDLHLHLRGVGYAESVAGDLDGAVLLGLDTADAPGVERGRDGRPTGRLWRADAWPRGRLCSSALDLTAVG